MSIGASNLWKREKIIRPATGRVSRQNNRQYYHATTPNSIRTRVTPSHIHTSTHIHTYTLPATSQKFSAGRRPALSPTHHQTKWTEDRQATRQDTTKWTRHRTYRVEEDTKGRRLRAERNLTRGQGDTTGQDTEWSEAKLDRAAPPRGKDDATLARGHADTLAQHTAAAADTRGDTRGGHERRHMRCDTNHWLTHPCAVAAGETHTLTWQRQ